MYQTKLLHKWNKSDEISVYYTKHLLSDITSKKVIVSVNIFISRKDSEPFFQSQLKISCSYVFYLFIQEKISHVVVY